MVVRDGILAAAVREVKPKYILLQPLKPMEVIVSIDGEFNRTLSEP